MERLNRLRGLLRVAPLLLAGCVGGAATVWSPISCSCTAAWDTIVTGLGVEPGEVFGPERTYGPEQLTQQFIAERIRDRFAGKTVKAADLPFATSTSDCMDVDAADHAVHCRWWIWQSEHGKKGFEVLIKTDPAGTFQRVLVTQVESAQ